MNKNLLTFNYDFCQRNIHYPNVHIIYFFNVSIQNKPNTKMHLLYQQVYISSNNNMIFFKYKISLQTTIK